MEQQGGSNIGSGMWMLLIGIAIFVDVIEALINLIPILGQILSMIIDGLAFATFWLIFRSYGEKYSKKTMLAGAIIGFIPIIDMLPECTLTIVKIYLDTKAKEKLAKAQSGAGVLNMQNRNTRAIQGANQDAEEMQRAA